MMYKKKVMGLEAKVKSLESILAEKDSLLQETKRSIYMYSTAWRIMKRVRKVATNGIEFIPFKQWIAEFKSGLCGEEYTHGQEEILYMLALDIRSLCNEYGYGHEDANGYLLKTKGHN